MKVLVVGAAGRTGRAVVTAALAAGHEVTALVRSDAGQHVPGVAVRAGDATDPPVGRPRSLVRTPWSTPSAAGPPTGGRRSRRTWRARSSAACVAMEAEVGASGLDRVITRPAVLSDAPATGGVRAFPAATGERARTLPRADLAAFLVAQLTSDDHLHRTATLATR